MINIINNVKKTQDEYISEVSQKNKNVIVLGKYVNARTKILHACKICGNKWNAMPDSILRGSGCKKCASKKLSEDRLMNEELFIEQIEKVNPGIKIIGKYVGKQKRIKCQCKKCAYIWSPNANSISRETGCHVWDNEKIGESNRKSHKCFVEELNKVNKNILILSEYLNSYDKVKCKCKIDGYEWYARPYNLLSGRGCPMCSNNAHYTTERFVDKIEHINPHIKIIGEYKTAKEKISCKCKICDFMWDSSPNSLLNGTGCPKCSHHITLSYNDFLNGLNNVNPNIIVSGKYIKMSTNIHRTCTLDA